ncbi:rRNA-processing UTP23 homolog [Babesia ovis]|uniref:rRNA-processing UTP23 homolog n=1 Tax=Babesia ovis TaxID=5869 RepID=A0A9W5T7R0_BABOV|nr:rRNA-processing UTP23 homolog [Babesia ovis]
MKASKHKRVKRTLDFYRQLYELTEPYRVLVDGSFAFAGLKQRINIKEQLTELLGGTTHTYVTNCIVNELREMGDEMSGVTLALKRYQRLHCTHESNDKGPNSRRCITSAVSDGNPQKLFVATQDQTLILWLRELGYVPIVKFNNNVVFLEHPPRISKEYKDMVEKEKQFPKDWEKSHLPVMAATSTARPKRKRKKQKNPNPLSCLKSKKKNKLANTGGPKPIHDPQGNSTVSPKRVRKRRRKGPSEASVATHSTNTVNTTTATEL